LESLPRAQQMGTMYQLFNGMEAREGKERGF